MSPAPLHSTRVSPRRSAINRESSLASSVCSPLLRGARTPKATRLSERQPVTRSSSVSTTATTTKKAAPTYKSFGCVPQRSFFAPCKSAVAVAIYSTPSATIHASPSEFTMSPVLRAGAASPSPFMSVTPSEAMSPVSPSPEFSAPCTPSKRKAKNASPKSNLANFRGKVYQQEQENQGVDVPQCVHSGCHHILWAAASNGSIELRSMADPMVLLNVIPPIPTADPSNNPTQVITTLTQIGQNQVVAGDSTGGLHVFSAQSGALLSSKQAHSKAILSMAVALMPTENSEDDPNELFYPRASVLLTGSADGTIAKWDGVTLDRLGSLSAGKKAITSIASCHSGCYAFSGCEGGTIRLWNLVENAEVKLSSGDRRLLTEVRKGLGDAAGASRDYPSTPVSPQRGSRLGSATKKFGASSPLPPRKGPVSNPVASQLVAKTSARASVQRMRGVVGTPHATPVRARNESAPSTPRTGGGRSSSVGVSRPLTSSLFSSVVRTRSAPAGEGKKVSKAAKAEELSGEEVIRRLEEVLLDYKSKWTPVDPSPLFSATEWSEEVVGLNFAFPLLSVHKDQVTDVEVIDDRFLVSCSRDASIHLFSLPSGRFIKSLKNDGRRVALKSVVFNKPTMRLFVFSCDGDVSVFNLKSVRADCVLRLQPSVSSPGCTYSVLPSRSFYRFFFLASGPHNGEEPSTGTITALAQLDRNISAPPRKKKRKVLGSSAEPAVAVGEVSSAEVELATKLASSQQIHSEARRFAESAGVMGTVEDMEIEDHRQSGLLFQRSYFRQFGLQFFLKWQRWTERRRSLQESCRGASLLLNATQRSSMQFAFSHWRAYATQHCNQKFINANAVSLKKDVLDTHMAARRHTFRQQQFVVRFLSANVARQRGLRCFLLWAQRVKERCRFEDRQAAYNRLLLCGGPSYSSTAFVLAAVARQSNRSSVHERSLHVLSLQQKESEILLYRLYWSKWTAFCTESRMRLMASGWRSVATHGRPQPLRLQYFVKWRAFAAQREKRERLHHAGCRARDEWLRLQDAIKDTQTEDELRRELLQEEAASIKISDARERQQVLRSELEVDLASLRVQESFQMFLSRFDGFGQQDGAEITPSVSAVSTPRHFASGHQRTRSWFRALGGREEDIEDTSETGSLDGGDLRRNVFCILRALKASSLHFGRDAAKLSTAFDSVAAVNSIEVSSKYDRVSGPMPLRGGRSSDQSRTDLSQEFGHESISEAFNSVFSELLSVIYAAAREAGIDPSSDVQLLGSAVQKSKKDGPLSTNNISGTLRLGGGGTGNGVGGSQNFGSMGTTPPSSVLRSHFTLDAETPTIRMRHEALASFEALGATPQRSVSQSPVANWVQFVSRRSRQEAMQLVVHLLLLFDCFLAPNDLNSAPLSGLCSQQTAVQLVRHAALLLELLQPQIWERQQHLNSFHSSNDALDEIASEVQSLSFSSAMEHISTPRMRSPQPAQNVAATRYSAGGIEVPPLDVSFTQSETRGSRNIVSGLRSTSSLQYHSPTMDDGVDDRRSLRSTPRGSVKSFSTQGGKVYQRPFLGFRVHVSRDPATGRSFIGIKEVTQTYTTPTGEVTKGPAAIAGLQVGDQFVRFAHYAVTDLAAFNAVVARHVRPGVELPVVVLRCGEVVSTSLKVTARIS